MARQHHHGILTAQPDKIVEARELFERCEALVTSKQPEQGPTTWCVSTSEDSPVFVVDALFENQADVEFHQANIAAIVKEFSAMMAAPPETVITPVIAAAS